MKTDTKKTTKRTSPAIACATCKDVEVQKYGASCEACTKKIADQVIIDEYHRKEFARLRDSTMAFTSIAKFNLMCKNLMDARMLEETPENYVKAARMLALWFA